MTVQLRRSFKLNGELENFFMAVQQRFEYIPEGTKATWGILHKVGGLKR